MFQYCFVSSLGKVWEGETENIGTKENLWWGEWKKLIDVRHVLVSGFYTVTMKKYSKLLIWQFGKER